VLSRRRGTRLAAPAGRAPVPYATFLHGGAVAVGLIFAAVPLGGAVSSAAAGKAATPQRQIAWIPPLAALTCATLALCLIRPALPWLLLILFGCGLFTRYQVAANTAFMTALPGSQRGLAFGVAGAGLWTTQGLTVLVAVAADSFVSPPVVIAVSGILGMSAAAALAVSSRQADRAATSAPALLRGANVSFPRASFSRPVRSWIRGGPRQRSFRRSAEPGSRCSVARASRPGLAWIRVRR
jgi:hypothetical protein